MKLHYILCFPAYVFMQVGVHVMNQVNFKVGVVFMGLGFGLLIIDFIQWKVRGRR